MRYRTKLLAAWGLLSLLFASGAQTDDPDAVLLTAEGRVQWQAVGRDDWAAVATNQHFRAHEKVRTGLKSRATVRLANQTVARMNQLTTIEIQPRTRDNKRSLIDFKEGAAFFHNRETDAQNSFRTPAASGAIRGTEFHLAVDSMGNTVVTMLDGEVDLSSPLGAVRLVSGEQGIVEAGRPPRKTAILDAMNVIQWALYYPAILDVSELSLDRTAREALGASLAAYQSGNLAGAAEAVPEGFTPASDQARIYQAATLLFVGQVEEAERLLGDLGGLGRSLRQLVAAVKFREFTSGEVPALATEWLARSYYLQSRADLEGARAAARAATRKSPRFGFAWARLAELEFGFGQTEAALAAANQALELTPGNAQALSLQGYLLSAKNQWEEGLAKFQQAIDLDPALGNAWLGRGLAKIRAGQIEAGRQDLQTALTLEPNRAILRSYAGKAHHREGHEMLARKEFDLARRLDPGDPTPFLYSALLNQRENRLNEAVRDLEISQELNHNRAIFRSRLLLDQDRAVRSANLAAIYRDNGMVETSFREAARAVNYDYGNYSAHLFLANSYDALRDPRQINLRYETPWLSELFLANLLQPVGGGSLSQNVSHQEYSRFFEGNRLGFISLTEYFSNGDWFQRASQYGHYNETAYSIDVNYDSINGWRPNNDSEALTTYLKVKHQITPQDSILLQGIYYEFESGDVAQYYDQSAASRTQRIKESQEPLLFAGYNHEWAPGNNTLLLLGRYDDTFRRSDPNGQVAKVIRTPVLPIGTRRFEANSSDIEYRSEMTGYSADLQQIWDATEHGIVAGARFQTADLAINYASLPDQSRLTVPPVIRGSINSDIERYSIYLYDHWQVLDSLVLIGGLSYDRLHYPANTEILPLIDREESREQVSPKAGFIYQPWTHGFFRGAYTRSLGGVFFDNSFRLEPVQIAGFTQLYRSMIPESALGAGVLPGARFETFGLGYDQRLGKGTYLGLDAELLNSTGDLTLGAHDFTGSTVSTISTLVDKLDYQEQTLQASVSQFLGAEWSVGARYRLTWARLEHRFNESRLGSLDKDEEAMLHQVNLHAIYHLPCGFFSQFHAIWSRQDNEEALSVLPGDNFWHLNLYAGYRFLQRRAEVRVGLLNITDRDYQLHPLTLYSELPRERTFYAALKLSF
jgi:Flp pilus assembly protein TadD